MRRDELTPDLQAPYSTKRGYGLVHAAEPGYEHIWFVVPPPPPREVPAGLPLKALAKAGEALARLPTFAEMTPLDKLTSYFFVRREAVESSRMEGTWSTIDDILTPVQALDSSAEEEGRWSVRGYAHTLESHLLAASSLKENIFTPETILRIHSDIVSKDKRYRGAPGALREAGKPGGIVRIGNSPRKEESTYNPPPPEFVPASLRLVLDWLADEDMAQRGDAGTNGFTLPVRLAIGHAHFESVHPFTDGNGRVGRALWPLQMACSDRMPLYLSGFVESEREDYGRCLQEAQKKLSYGPIVEFVCEAVTRADAEARATRAAIESLPAAWKARAKFREDSAALRSLEVLQRCPIITAATLVEELSSNKPAVSRALEQLVERGVIRLRGRAGRVQVYAAEELISLLSRPFGSDPQQALAEGRRALARKS